MCISVRRSNTTIRPWDPASRTITIPAGLSHGRSLIAVQAVLTELGIPQPRDAAVCFCGAPVLLTRVPRQRITMEGVRVAS
jgi:hypothetical protein